VPEPYTIVREPDDAQARAVGFAHATGLDAARRVGAADRLARVHRAQPNAVPARAVGLADAHRKAWARVGARTIRRRATGGFDMGEAVASRLSTVDGGTRREGRGSGTSTTGSGNLADAPGRDGNGNGNGNPDASAERADVRSSRAEQLAAVARRGDGDGDGDGPRPVGSGVLREKGVGVGVSVGGGQASGVKRFPVHVGEAASGADVPGLPDVPPTASSSSRNPWGSGDDAGLAVVERLARAVEDNNRLLQAQLRSASRTPAPLPVGRNAGPLRP
jgi:hypothetical protein